MRRQWLLQAVALQALGAGIIHAEIRLWVRRTSMIVARALALAVALMLMACDTTPVEQPKPDRPPTKHTHSCLAPSGVAVKITHIHGSDEGFSRRWTMYSVMASDAPPPDRECLDHAYPDWPEDPRITD